MNDPKHWTVPKWPFLLGDALLLLAAALFVFHSPHPVDHWEIVVSGCVALGAILAVMPYFLDYRAVGKAIEASALGSITEELQSLEKLAAQIKAATNEWTNAQTQAEKTSAGAKQITDQMANEARQFGELMQRMNDTEKNALRLEVEKLRRSENEWLQILVRILDNVFVLHTSALRTGQPELAGSIAKFQNACHDAARRIGLISFIPVPGEVFDAKRHQVIGTKQEPPPGATIAETVGVGFTFQGQLLRTALVRLQTANPSKEAASEDTGATESFADKKGQDELSLQQPD